MSFTANIIVKNTELTKSFMEDSVKSHGCILEAFIKIKGGFKCTISSVKFDHIEELVVQQLGNHPASIREII